MDVGTVKCRTGKARTSRSVQISVGKCILWFKSNKNVSTFLFPLIVHIESFRYDSPHERHAGFSSCVYVNDLMACHE